MILHFLPISQALPAVSRHEVIAMQIRRKGLGTFWAEYARRLSGQSLRGLSSGDPAASSSWTTAWRALCYLS